MEKTKLKEFLSSLKKDDKVLFALKGQTPEPFKFLSLRKGRGRGGSLIATLLRVSDGLGVELKSGDSEQVTTLERIPEEV